MSNNEIDLKTFAQPTEQSSAQWQVAGTVRKSGSGKIGALVEMEVYVTFDDMGNMVIPVGGKDSGQSVKITPEITDFSAVYKIGNTALSVSKKHIGNVLVGAEGAYATVNRPPSLERINPNAAATAAEAPAAAEKKASPRSKKSTE